LYTKFGFELSVAKKYLIPRKKQLSVSLIALMSVTVISLVVWLVLVFLSVTEGMERGWMERLTTLSGPIRITPKETYFSSYYYQIDTFSEKSHFTHKTIGEKKDAPLSDPYLSSSDMQLPENFPQKDLDSSGALKDPVKIAFEIFKQKGLIAQDFELGGALLRLHMARPTQKIRKEVSHQFLSQVSYLSSFSDKNPKLSSLLLSPTMQDINHLFYLANYQEKEEMLDSPGLRPEEPHMFQEKVSKLLAEVDIHAIKTNRPYWKLPPSLVTEGSVLHVDPFFKGEEVSHLIVLSQGKGKLEKRQGALFLVTKEHGRILLKESVPLLVNTPLTFKASLKKASCKNAKELKDLHFAVETPLHKGILKGELPWEDVEIADASISPSFTIKNLSTNGILLPKHFQDLGARIGDKGYLSYQAKTAGSLQEQRLPISVAGFYDPGILSIGNKSLLVPPSIVRAINTSSQMLMLDTAGTNGIQVWFSAPLSQVDSIQKSIEQEFADQGIAPYWKVSSFKEYDFAKDLLQQFRSDKYLFTLVAVLILIVACCNIISLLVLLVNDKKKEIGILQAMGASRLSIAAIFGLCGVLMGLLSSLVGTLAALFTLHHIDGVVSILSFLQGHEAFQAAFYGSSLPNTLSQSACLFVLIATPLISLCAGLVPAIKACISKPSMLLRGET